MPYQTSGANLYRDASNFGMRCCTAPRVVAIYIYIYVPCLLPVLAQTVMMLMVTSTTKRVRGQMKI